MGRACPWSGRLRDFCLWIWDDLGMGESSQLQRFVDLQIWIWLLYTVNTKKNLQQDFIVVVFIDPI